MIADFFHGGWSIFVAAATIAGLVFCLALLVIAARRKVVIGPDGKPEETTGHVWDGDIVEMNNPLPRWWMVLFVLTVFTSVVYLVLYPGLGSAKGTLDWSSVNQYEGEQDRARATMAPVYEKYAAMDAAQLVQDSAAMGIGERLFINNCATCHGSDARGSKSFPNLTDTDWLHGGSHEKIKESITQGRVGVMPPMAAAVGSAQEVRNVAHYVLSLSGSPHNSLAAQLGRVEVRRVRGLPRRRRHRQPGAGRAQPDRSHLAARLGRGRHRGDDQRRQDQRDAGPGRAAHA